MIDLLNISYTEESSVLTECETAIYPAREYEYGRYSDYELLFRAAHDLTSWHCA